MYDVCGSRAVRDSPYETNAAFQTNTIGSPVSDITLESKLVGTSCTTLTLSALSSIWRHQLSLTLLHVLERAHRPRI